jgi:signal transduction histidine kinase
MSNPLRLLIIEDSEDDAILVVRELRSGGFSVDYKRVDCEAALSQACDLDKWDLIISDFSMPQFSGTDALKVVRSKSLDVPFIFVSGTMGEETAVRAMRNGAQDYLVKDNLKRLCPAVQRELQEYAERKERRRLEKHVQQLQKFEAIGRLSGGIAHDFNNMIGAILGWAELGATDTKADRKSRQRFEKIREQSQRAAELTAQLLALGRKQLLHPRNVDLNVIVNEEMRFLERIIERNIEIKILACPKLEITYADPTQIQQVLMNLCLNARDAMPEGGQLTIETSNFQIGQDFQKKHPEAIQGTYVALKVTDTGVGMDPATAEQIFEPFFTTKQPGQGTGLGLATVYGIVKQHGGFIYVETALGKGSSFEVYLRAKSGTHEPVQCVEAEETVRGCGTILLVEDHDGLSESIQESLKSLGYHTLVATDGVKAVELYCNNANQIDVILMDLIVPGLGGIEAYSQMCSVRSSVPVIFTSGYAPSSASTSTLLKQGAVFLQKPYSLAKLSQTIRDIKQKTCFDSQMEGRHIGKEAVHRTAGQQSSNLIDPR